ncbi:ABC transporter ATP-binding protein [Calidifontibacillus oryziterrae]|uniref:ABC transporter ATP-binding protein n=1 Tax=Calidifontibacillus oryziterrae TaxID=1191699 RepID=UPI0002F8585D|nr:ABC transporter ATP-binding protein [Calidifontibacillus oryziterrae]
MRFEVKRLTFGYEQHDIFNNLSFSIRSGEMLALLGPNGIGKTTLFKSLLGLLHVNEGEILIDGEDIKHWSRTKLAQVIGYVPQNHTPPFPFKVVDVILMGRTAYLKSFTMPAREDYDIALEAMDILQISYLKDKIYTEISGGERQLVLIARALAQKPKLLIMDEPTSNLDFGNQIKVLKHIKHLANNGLAIILSTHNPDHALRYASKAVLMEKGGFHIVGKPEDILTNKKLSELYEIDVNIVNVAISELDVKVCVSL